MPSMPNGPQMWGPFGVDAGLLLLLLALLLLLGLALGVDLLLELGVGGARVDLDAELAGLTFEVVPLAGPLRLLRLVGLVGHADRLHWRHGLCPVLG